MRISLILAHPDPKSLNHAIARRVRARLKDLGHRVSFHDLYREGFDARITAGEMSRDASLEPRIATHCRQIAAAEGIVIVHPNWWGMPPAILKGWIDRVIRPGIAYEFKPTDSGEGVPVGLLKARTAVIFNTANTYPEREQTVFGDPLETIWKNCIFGLCGITDVRRTTFSVVVTSTRAERTAWLDQAASIITDAFPHNQTTKKQHQKP